MNRGEFMNSWYEKTIQQRSSLVSMEQLLFEHPELGFKEVQTRSLLLSYFEQHGLRITKDFGINGFQMTIGSGHPHIALIAEMDALVVPGHFMQGPDSAAHACGHHLQGTILAHVLTMLNDASLPNGRVSFFAIAAEEYVDLAFRKTLQAKGTIPLLSGKQNLILQQAFDDVDVAIGVHTMGETTSPKMEINASLSGFIYKSLTFKGQGAHAAVMPHEGVNALNALALTQTAIAFLRETFQEDDRIRIHLITTQGGQSVNSVPEQAVLEGYVRAQKPEVLKSISERVNQAAIHSAKAIGASVEIHDSMGYLPLVQSRELSEVIKSVMLDVVDEVVDNQLSFAAGDIGDMSVFLPTIQIGFSGCVGRVHGSDFKMQSIDEALIFPTYAIVATVERLLNEPQTLVHIKQAHQPSMTLSEYKALHGVLK
jgi:amidohydrolase